MYEEPIEDVVEDEGRCRVMFSIDFPNYIINQKAHENKVESTLSLIGVPYFVKAPYNNDM